MSDDRANQNEGADPSRDIADQKNGETAITDLTHAGDGDKAEDVDEDDPDKTDKLARAGRDIDTDDTRE